MNIPPPNAEPISGTSQKVEASPRNLPPANVPPGRRMQRVHWENRAAKIAILGDMLMVLLGFLFAFWLRYKSGFGFEIQPEATLTDFSELIGFGVILVYAGLFTKNSGDLRDLLSPAKTVAKYAFTLSIGLFVLIGISLTFRTTPPISRLFVVIAWLSLFLGLFLWRYTLSRVLRRPSLAVHLRRRLVVVGVGPETLRLKHELCGRQGVEMVGWIEAGRPNCFPELNHCQLGRLTELEAILRRYQIDVVVLVETEQLQAGGVGLIQAICEREHVQFKMVPHFFEILISGLKPSVIGGVPVLSVQNLPLQSFANRAAKRLVDIIGALVGLTISLPLMLIFGALVYAESPGPIFYRQRRTGRNGQPFDIVKIRSMRLDAEQGSQPGWTVKEDPRRLGVGTFMRKWNIDEVPQFWNVLTGEMSLVGPRPERPELIEKFQYNIPHYQSRHACRPGLSGWAQVNGLRGDTSLEERIRFDIWYVENWSLWLDFKIMFLTFASQKNAC